jgi:hypothetical protein
MWNSRSAFERGLYAEHLEELVFLYGQARHLRMADEGPWTRLLDFEWRIAAHLDGLHLGGAAALEEMAARFDADDPGHWSSAALVRTRRGDAGLFTTLLTAAVETSEAATAAVADSLRHLLPANWPAGLLGGQGRLPEPAVEALAAALACGNVDAARPLVKLLHTPAASASAAQIEVHSRAGRVDWVPGLAAIAEADPSPARRRAALLALARLGSPEALPLARRLVADALVAHDVLGWIGTRDDALALLRQCERKGATPQSLRALGWLGDLAVVRPLLKWLADEALAPAAADALHLITGHGPTEQHPLDADDDEPAADAPADEQGRYAPLRAGATALPAERATITRPSRDAAAWAEWLAQAKGRFVSGVRYRLGQPVTAGWLVQCLAADVPGHGYRALAAEELVLRYQPPVRLDPLASVARQRAALAALQAWAPSHDQVAPGAGTAA